VQLNESFPDDMVVRFGGEEFSIIMANTTAIKAAEQAETLRLTIEQLRPTNVNVTFSIGVACSEDYPEADITKLMSLADKALYSAKENGRNRVYISYKQSSEPLNSPSDESITL